MAATPDLELLRLAHVALISADPAALAAHYEDTVGLVDLAAGADGVRRLTTNGFHHCLEIHPGDGPGLDHIAFEVRDAAAAGEALSAGGAVETVAVDAVGYAAAVAFDDPEGNTIRLVSGPEAGDAIAPGDRTFRPSKVGHIGVRAEDPAAQARFFTEVVGFRLSDWIGEQVVFLRCNPDHHVLVFVAEPRAEGESAVHHVAYEVGSFEDFARQADLLAAHDVRVDWGPGRHAPSRNYFMYFDDADGNRIEWVNSIKQIPDDGTYVPEVYDPAVPTTWNVWGVMPPPYFLQRIGPGEPATAAGA
jgi:catechol-2,3-dioxygenase